MADNNWKDEYKSKLTSAKKALSKIKRGDRIFIGSGCGEPQYLVKEFEKMADQLSDIEILHVLSMGSSSYTDDRFRDKFRLKSFFIASGTRDAVLEGRADYTPIFLSDVPGLFKSGQMPINVAIIQVSPPDLHGFCSYGINVDITKSASENAKILIAQVNKKMPRTLGDSFIHISQISSIVEWDDDLITIPPAKEAFIERRIGKHVAKLVEDGSTIQAGIGRIVFNVTLALKDKKDIGIHSDSFNDALLALVKSGAVTNKKKGFHDNKIITSFCLGSQELYDFVNDNPMVEFHPTEYVNDPFIISKNKKMVCINAAIEVDLTGQVCADSFGYQVYSGIGGYVDFMRGASKSNGGKPIIVLPSLSQDGKKSRIVTHISEGGGVVTTRGAVYYIVTEFGIAYLHGKTIRERALALINIAHPRFRSQLLNEAKLLKYIYEDQILPLSKLYPDKYETKQIFDGDNIINFRPIKPTDERALQEFFYSLPDKDIYYRFLSAMKVFPHRDTQALCNIDYETEMTIVATVGEMEKEKIIGMGQYIFENNTNMAEVDFAVGIGYQRMGIGSFLVHYLVEIAKGKGINGFTAYVLATNRKMMSVFNRTGYVIRGELTGGVYNISFKFDEPAQQCFTD